MKPFGVVASLLLAGCGQQPVALRLGSPPEEPGPTIAGIIAASLENGGLDVSVSFFESNQAMLAALSGGALELALVEEPIVPHASVAMVLPLYPSVLHVLKRDSVTGSLRSALAGRVYAGPPGSFGYQLARELAEDFDVADLKLLADPWSETPDAYFVFGGLLQKDAIGQLEGFSLLDLNSEGRPDGESIVDAIVLRHPNLRPFTLPAGLYPAIDNDAVRTIATTTLLAASDQLDETTVYRIARHLSENDRPLRMAYPLAHASLAADMKPDGFGLPLHAGSRMYMNRDLPSFVERNIDIIALVTTLALAGASAIIGWLHRTRRARKDRIDRFLSDLLEIRGGLALNMSAHPTSRLDFIERNVLELVIAEKIEVDAGLVAFLQLSASIRAQILQLTEEADHGVTVEKGHLVAQSPAS